MSSQHISTVIINNIKTIEKVAGIYGVRCFKAATALVRAKGVDLHAPANLSWLQQTPVAELDSYGIFAAVDSLDGTRFFYLDAAMRDEDQADLDER